jgi:hypothetical protein
MRGHTKIIEMRLKRQVPPFVFINDWPCKTDWFDYGDHATVCTAGDQLSNLDFRFLVGLRVSISAVSEDRAKSLFDRVKAAGASVVAACHVQADKHPTDQSGWARVWHEEVVNA